MKEIDFKLYFYQKNKLFKKVAVEKGYHFNLIVGSGVEADIKLDNPRVSRQHLQIVYNKEGELHLQDLGSTNGTFLNGIQLNRGDGKLLKHKDKLQLAGVNGILVVVEQSKTGEVTSTQTDIIDKLKTKNRITIGRNSDCDIVLNNDTVSRYHATIERSADGAYTLKDANSSNGTYVNGRKIKGITRVTKKDKIYIGRHQLSLEGKTKDLRDELAITAIGIEKTYTNGKKRVKALKKMDLAVPSKSLLAIMGPSGCGKSTLLKALNGDTPASKGKVFLFNQELRANYEYLKTKIGYVPQDDIIHKQLTIQQCLYFTAKLRLDNLPDEDIEKKINQVLTDLNMFDEKGNLMKDNFIYDISGGQRKRVSIAVELMTDPLILFLDEPTSPLDPSTIEDFLENLQELSKKGTTVIMVTHKPEDLDYMDEVIFMAEGGNIVYYGDSKRYKEYFSVKTAVSVFSQITGKSKNEWIRKYLNPRPLSNSSSSSEIKVPSEKSNINQFKWLTKRYFKIKTNDKVNSFIMLIQAPIIAILICIIFKEISAAVLFMMAISSIWLGTQNAAREIVSENAIYKRERMFNLQIFPYLLSKISVLSFFSIIQSAIFIFILAIRYSDTTLSLNDPIEAFLWMSFLSIAATFLGLLLSAIVDTTEKAMTIVPLILIPQIMLAGLIAKVSNGFVEMMSYFTLSRWGVEGLNIIQRRIIEEKPNLTGGTVPIDVDALDMLHKSFLHNYENPFTLDIFVIIIMTGIMTFFIFRTLKNKEPI